MYRMLIITLILSSFNLFPNELYNLSNSFLKQDLDSYEIFEVNDLIVVNEKLILYLESGEIAKFKTQFGYNLYYFSGSGIIAGKLDSRLNESQIRRIFGQEVLDETFSNAIFLGNNLTLIEENLKTPLAMKKLKNLDTYYTNFKNAYLDKKSGTLAPEFVIPLLNKYNFMAAYLDIDGQDDDFLLEYSDFENQELRLSMLKTMTSTYNDIKYIVLQFNKKESQNLNLNYLDIISITGNYQIENDLSLSAKVFIELKPARDSLKWFNLNLDKKLNIKSIKNNGKSIFYHRDSDSDIIYINLKEAIDISGLSLEFEFEGNIINRLRDITFVERFTNWYPDNGFYEMKNFELEFKTAEKYVFAASGQLVNLDKKDGYQISKWKTVKPSIHFGFNIGVFNQVIEEIEDGPKFLIQSLHTDQLDAVKLDLKQGYEFYSKLLGDLEYKLLIATEIPYPHGQAFPQFIHLSYITFISSDRFGGQESFVTHELAHQWWGANVVPNDYGDVWLSEGISEYYSLMYLQIVSKNSERFFDMLEKMKDRIIATSERNIPAGSVGIGTHSGWYNYENDYQTIIYEKGAWVIHMLRNLLLDVTTMNEDLFKNVMKDFYTKFKGKRASTEDFKNTLEEYLNIDLDWFFNQWVYDYQIPTYEIANKIEKVENGYQPILQVSQKNVNEDFIMAVPVSVIFDDGRAWRTKVSIDKTTNKLLFPVFEEKPSEIEFNSFYSVLCKIKNVDFVEE